jgi:hypothetical protein
MAFLLPTRLALGNYFPGSPPASGGQPEQAVELRQAVPPSPPSSIEVSVDDLAEMSQEQYNLKQSDAVTLGYSLVTLSESGTHDVLIFQAARYKDVADGEYTFRFGVAIEATTEKFEGGLTLPAVAANVQLSNASASSDLAVRGYLPKTALQLPAWGSFDVGSYTEFQTKVSNLQSTVLSDNDSIRPVLLATTKTVPGAEQVQKSPHGFFYCAGQYIEKL